MGKIGILTTSHAINYGAVLQAFSLKKAIEENTHKKVEIINYCGDEWLAGRKIYRKNTNLKNFVVNIISLFRFRYRNSRKILFNQFDDFKKNYLDIHGEIINSEDGLKMLQGYEYFVCGSDQVWNMSLFNDSAYFLTFADRSTDKIAYAVSISDFLSNEQIKIIVERVKDFKAVSIREQDDAQRLAKIMEREVKNLIDPVFLHNASEWKRLLLIPKESPSPYLLVFLISHHVLDQEIITKLKGNRKIVILNLHPINYVQGDQMLNSCPPGEFVKLIANADAVITDSFHCTAFSIIFNKLFYNIRRPTRNNRIENLYKKFGIGSRFVSNVDTPGVDIPYKDINVALENESNKGKKFIIDNIGEI